MQTSTDKAAADAAAGYLYFILSIIYTFVSSIFILLAVMMGKLKNPWTFYKDLLPFIIGNIVIYAISGSIVLLIKHYNCDKPLSDYDYFKISIIISSLCTIIMILNEHVLNKSGTLGNIFLIILVYTISTGMALYYGKGKLYI